MSTTDLVREIRLRQWARRHFVSAELRKSTWHPIVLEEMQLRDQELIMEAVAAETIAVETIADDKPFAVETPSLIAVQVQESEFVATGTVDELLADVSARLDAQSTFNRSYERNLGASIVPLPPDGFWELHAGTSEVPKPHSRTFIWETVVKSHDVV